MENLNDGLAELKLAVDNPRIYIANFFTELRIEVDIQCEEYIRKIQAKSLNLEQIASDYRTAIISEIKMHEEICYSNLYKNELSIYRLGRTVKEVEYRLSKMIEPDLLKKSIHERLRIIRRLLLGEKTFILLTEASDLISVFYKKSIQSFGVLIVIENQFINTETLFEK